MASTDPHLRPLYDEAWEALARWLEEYRRTHPDDQRTDYDLVDVYYAEMLGR